MGTPAIDGAVPPTRSLAQPGAPAIQEAAGLAKNKSAEGAWRGGWDPGSARGNLSSEVTFSSCAVSKLQAPRTRWRERRKGCPRLEHAGLPSPVPSVSPLPCVLVDRTRLTVGSCSSPSYGLAPVTLREP